MHKFEIGMRVKCNYAICGEESTDNAVGTIIYVNPLSDLDIGIEFDEYTNGHDCGGLGKAGYCWWANGEVCEPYDTDLVPDPIIEYSFDELMSFGTYE